MCGCDTPVHGPDAANTLEGGNKTSGGHAGIIYGQVAQNVQSLRVDRWMDEENTAPPHPAGKLGRARPRSRCQTQGGPATYSVLSNACCVWRLFQTLKLSTFRKKCPMRVGQWLVCRLRLGSSKTLESRDNPAAGNSQARWRLPR